MEKVPDQTCPRNSIRQYLPTVGAEPGKTHFLNLPSWRNTRTREEGAVCECFSRRTGPLRPGKRVAGQACDAFDRAEEHSLKDAPRGWPGVPAIVQAFSPRKFWPWSMNTSQGTQPGYDDHQSRGRDLMSRGSTDRTIADTSYRPGAASEGRMGSACRERCKKWAANQVEPVVFMMISLMDHKVAW